MPGFYTPVQIFLGSYSLQVAISDYKLVIDLDIKVCIFPKVLINVFFFVGTISIWTLCPDERQHGQTPLKDLLNNMKKLLPQLQAENKAK